jgi:GNAT superfamily N-acetyltransferase
MRIEIRNFKESDMEDFQRLYNVCERENPDYRPLTLEEARKVVFENRGHDPKAHFAAFERGELVCSGRGLYSPDYVKVKGPVGFIELYVLPDYLGTSVEKEVFARIAEYVRTCGVELIQTRVDTRFESKVHLLERLGFSKSEYQNHGMEMAPSLAEEPREPDGYGIRTVRFPDELETMVSVFNEAFATRDKYPPKTVENFSRGWAMEDEENHSGFFFAEREADGNVVGMVLSALNRKYNEEHGVRRGGTYALAVVPSDRKKGLGTALTLKSLEWIRNRGMDVAYVSVNIANPDAFNIYRILGYQTVQVYQGYRINIQ